MAHLSIFRTAAAIVSAAIFVGCVQQPEPRTDQEWFAHYLHQISNGTSQERWRALTGIQRLAVLEGEDKVDAATIDRVVELLVDCLHDRNPYVRRMSARNLETLGPRAARASEAIVARLDDPDREARRSVERAFVACADSVPPSLAARLESKRTDQVLQALRLIGASGERASSAKGVRRTVESLAQVRNKLVRNAARGVVADLWPTSAPAIDAAPIGSRSEDEPRRPTVLELDSPPTIPASPGNGSQPDGSGLTARSASPLFADHDAAPDDTDSAASPTLDGTPSRDGGAASTAHTISVDTVPTETAPLGAGDDKRGGTEPSPQGSDEKLTLVAPRTAPRTTGIVILRWDPVIADGDGRPMVVDGYRIFGADDDGEHTIDTDAGAALTYTVGNLVPGRKYSFAVAAYGEGQLGRRSITVEAVAVPDDTGLRF